MSLDPVDRPSVLFGDRVDPIEISGTVRHVWQVEVPLVGDALQVITHVTHEDLDATPHFLHALDDTAAVK